jgi:TRAP-type uncharacterized transport system fused permease subunit
MGYSVIRAGTYATAAAAVVSWLTPWRMGPRAIARAFELAGIMSIQIIAVCACAGIIVGVISLTGVGARFSSLLLGLAETSQLLALFFAMCIAILLGMGMPTTAAYAVAASVVAPGLVQLGIPMLTAHFFVFYFAVLSAITPPVALASYAAAGISGANPMETSVTSFKIGIAAFIVPFMFFYNAALLLDGSWPEVIRAGATATIGVWLLSAGVQGWSRPSNRHANRVAVRCPGALYQLALTPTLAGDSLCSRSLILCRKRHGGRHGTRFGDTEGLHGGGAQAAGPAEPGCRPDAAIAGAGGDL